MTTFTRFRRSLWSQEQLFILILGVAVGVLGGYGAVGFRWLIDFLRALSYGPGADFLKILEQTPWYYCVLIPALGGLAVGPLIHFLAREAKGHGVPEVMEAVTLKNGFIRKRVVAVKSLASAISIAVGGSVGREGPIVQICSALGSAVGQLTHASPNRMRILVGCGAAAGIAATFNAPVAGMMFALEIVLGEFAIATFSPIVAAAVVATAISRFHLGNYPAFITPTYHLASAWEFLNYALLGIIAGLAAAGFTFALYKMEDWADSVRMPPYLKPAVAGAALGFIGLAFPAVLGVGYEGIEMALAGDMVWWMCLLAVIVKIIATSLTIGGGMSGGIFAPSLVMGAMLGAGLGQIFHWAIPAHTAGPGAYAIVGMAAMVAGATHGPLSAFLILFEMTGGYEIILPLMTGCILATLTARWVNPASIYTQKLIRRGIDIQSGKDMNLLRSLKVGENMNRDVQSVPQSMRLGQFAQVVMRSKHASFPVVNEKGHLTGIISHSDYAKYIYDQDLWDVVVVMELATKTVSRVTPEDTLEDALRTISAKDYATLPVVNGGGDNRLVGVISHRDIISLYSRQIRKAALGERRRPGSRAARLCPLLT